MSILGFAINWKKSDPNPLQRIEHLGIALESRGLQAFENPDDWTSFGRWGGYNTAQL